MDTKCVVKSLLMINGGLGNSNINSLVVYVNEDGGIEMSEGQAYTDIGSASERYSINRSSLGNYTYGDTVVALQDGYYATVNQTTNSQKVSPPRFVAAGNTIGIFPCVYAAGASVSSYGYAIAYLGMQLPN